LKRHQPQTQEVAVRTPISRVFLIVAVLVGALLFAERSAAQDSTPLRSEADYVDPRLLNSDPDSYVGRNIYIQGNALTVEQEDDYTWVQVLAEVRDGETTESVIVYLEPPVKTLLSDECYRFFGTMTGTVTMTLRLTGAEVEVPMLDGYAYAPSEPGEYFGCAPPI
jgi:hypothetical protein